MSELKIQDSVESLKNELMRKDYAKITPVSMMRNSALRFHKYGIWICTGIAISSGLAYYYFYAAPKSRAMERYMKNHNAMKRWVEICEEDPTIFHSCPETRKKLMEEA